MDMLTEVKIFVTDGIPTEEDVKKHCLMQKKITVGLR